MRHNRRKIELNRQEFSIAHRPPLLRSVNWALLIGAPQRADLLAVGAG